MNALLLLGIAANALVTLSASVSSEIAWLGPILWTLVAVSVVGTILITSGQKRAGAITVIVGAIGFVPIGLLAVVGARRVLDNLVNEQFQKRRAAARPSSER